MFDRILASRTFGLLKSFKELLGLALFFFALIAAPLNPDLIILVRSEDLADNLKIQPSIDEKDSENTPHSNGRSLLTIELINKSFDKVDSIELTVNGISKLISTGVASTSSRMKLQSNSYAIPAPKGENAYFFPNLTTIPPRHSTKVQLIAEIDPPLFFENQVTVSSSARSSRVMHTTQIWGLLSFVHENQKILSATLFALVISLGLRRLHIEEKKK